MVSSTAAPGYSIVSFVAGGRIRGNGRGPASAMGKGINAAMFDCSSLCDRHGDT